MSNEANGAGASAFREYERRRAKDQEAVEARKRRVRDRFGGGRFGAAVASVTVDTRERSSTWVWAQGATGEVEVGRRLDTLAGPDVVVLHDRRIPGSRANIDHLVVTGAGIWVVDAKRYIGKRPERYSEGGCSASGRAPG